MELIKQWMDVRMLKNDGRRRRQEEETSDFMFPFPSAGLKPMRGSRDGFNCKGKAPSWLNNRMEHSC